MLRLLRRPATALTALAIAMVLLFAGARTLAAHGALKRATPAAGARLPSAPARLTLVFNERIDLTTSHLTLTDAGGREVRLGALRHPGDSSDVLVADITGAMAAGEYRVAWQITGRDGHPVRGSYRFRVLAGTGEAGSAAVAGASPGAPPGLQDTATSAAHQHHDSAERIDSVADDQLIGGVPAPAAFDAQSKTYVAVRWLTYIALLATIGASALALLLRRHAADELIAGLERGAARRLAAFGLAAAWAMLILAFARLFAQSAAVHGADRMFSPMLLGPMLGRSSWGRAWVLQLAAGMLAAGAWTAVLDRTDRRGAWRLAAVGAVLLALASALSGHAMAVRGPLAVLAVGADWAHTVAAGAWIGTLLAMVVVALPAARALRERQGGGAVARLVAAFTPWALICAGILGLTGVASAALHLTAPSELWTTDYGQALLRKLVAVAAVAAVGAFNWRRVAPSLGTDDAAARLARSGRLELAFSAVVLLLTAVLVATPPGR